MHFSIVAAGKNCPGCVIINASGEIVDETSRQFATFLSQNRLDGILPSEPAENLPVRSDSPKVIVAFESIGGKVQSALIIGRRIRKSGWTTVIGQARLEKGSPVFRSAGCYSACTMVMLGGSSRFAIPGSKIGIHQFSPQFNDGETFDSQEMSQIVRDYGREMVNVYDFTKAMGVSEDFFLITLRTPFNSLDLLPDDQWVSAGIATALLPGPENDDMPASTILASLMARDPTASIGRASPAALPPAKPASRINGSDK